MRFAFFRRTLGFDSARRQRAARVLAVLALHLLFLLVLLRLAPPFGPPVAERRLLAFQLLDQMEAAPSRSDSAHPRKRAADGGSKAQVKVAAKAPDETPAPLRPNTSTIWSQVVPVTSEQFASADVGTMKPEPGTGAGKTDGDGDDGGGDGQGGDGPHGERLYGVDWYRHPTDAELGFYLPSRGPREGWGEIACRTIPDNRVDRCEEIGQSSPGLAGAVRKAAWQFRILPPRIGGKRLMGAWVRIHIDYGVSKGAAR